MKPMCTYTLGDSIPILLINDAYMLKTPIPLQEQIHYFLRLIECIDIQYSFRLPYSIN